ncbi:hypothetical protein [Aquimarina rhabdastrellae]
MKTKLKISFSILFTLIVIIACVKEDETLSSNAISTPSLKHSGIYQHHNSSWAFFMEWMYSFGSCSSGPGVCFRNDNGESVIHWGGVDNSTANTDYVSNIQKAFNVLMNGNENPDNGVIAFKLEKDLLRMVFSRDLEEPYLNIKEDVTLSENVSRTLGKHEIIIPAGQYDVDRSNFEFGEVKVPIIAKDIVLDYHEDYGTILKKDYPVRREFTQEAYFKDLNISKRDLEKYQIIEAEFSGIAYAEHLIDGKIIHVWHKYEKEPVSIFEGVLHDGTPVSSHRIFGCGNQFGGYNSFDFFWAFIEYGCWWCD